MKVIIMLSGRSRSGKDTAFRYLETKGFVKYAIASRLKEVCGLMFDLSYSQMYGRDREIPDPRWDNKTPRELFQEIGTEIMQHHFAKMFPSIGRNYHIKCLTDNIKEDLVCITDLRFDHEYEYIRDHMTDYKVIVIEMIRDNSSNHTHSSEMGVKYKNYIIYNNSDIDALNTTLQRIIDNEDI